MGGVVAEHETNGTLTLLKRASLVIGVAGAVIYPTVSASMRWGEMQTELKANTDAVKDVAVGLKAIAKDQVDAAAHYNEAVMRLEAEIAHVVDINEGLSKENAALKQSVDRTRAAVKDNTSAVDWHSARIRQLEEKR